MKRKMIKILVLVVLFPIVSMAQREQSWKVSFKNKAIEWGTINDTSTLNLLKVKKGILSFSYLYPEKVVKSTQTIILMDSARKELKRVILNNNSANFNVKDLKGKSFVREIYIYSISTPKDMTVARRARIGTQFIGKIIL